MNNVNKNGNSLATTTPKFPYLDRDEFLTPFSSFFDEVWNSNFPSLDVAFFGKGVYPKVDIIDNENNVVIEAEVPGLNKEQVSVELDPNGTLRIKGEKNQEDSKKAKNYIHKELKKSSFCRSFYIGENIDKNTVDAKFDNGVLTITLNKLKVTPKEETKKIEIK